MNSLLQNDMAAEPSNRYSTQDVGKTGHMGTYITAKC